MKEEQLQQNKELAGAFLQDQPPAPQRILVVEDDVNIRRFVAKALAQVGYHVDQACDGAVAWKTLETNRYDLMLTDNNMPRVTGLQLLRQIQAAGLAMPVIMATGSLPEEFSQRPSIQPAAVLLKPYAFDELLRTVREVLCGACK